MHSKYSHHDFSGRHILVGITGGIAAYKTAELVRGLKKAGAEVRVVMTQAAEQFITPMTLQALSGNPVRTALFDPQHESAMGHIELARWADLVLIAPASANFMASLAGGLANNLLSTLCLATTAPIAIAPAMNQQMWQADATKENTATLKKRNVHILGPADGLQACGEAGAGRMLEPEELLQACHNIFATGPLAGVRITITAGPTREALDPVRYLSNRSSGKMGFAVATAATALGAKVRLVAGPVTLPTPAGVTRIDVESAEQMYQAVMTDAGDIFIACAAVADYRPVNAHDEKLKKNGDSGMTLNLQQNPDILAAVAAIEKPPFTVGFAAETENLQENAYAKLERKGLNMIAANRVGNKANGAGFDSDTNALELYWKDGGESLPIQDKETLARQLMAVITTRYQSSTNKIIKWKNTKSNSKF